ncbi:MAG: DUF1800 family protein [Erythrobacter sp.]|uniref:DUF1800 domain-containing protein n=1 Tax=Erythrobacter sp. TaxID=1042 RepID=UPI003267190C
MRTESKADEQVILSEGQPTRRSLFSLTALSVSTATLAACGGGGGQSNPASAVAPSIGSQPPTDSGPGAPSNTEEVTKRSRAARFLHQASFSASLAEIDEVLEQGNEVWLDRKISEPISQTAREYFSSRGFDRVDTNNHFDRSQTADFMIFSQLLHGNNAVRKKFAFALSQFFVVSLEGLRLSWPAIAIGSYWDTLNEHAFGDFRELLEAITLNPAMATYLDTIGNQKADSQSMREPDENFAREVMQLFTIGVTELNMDGTPKIVGGRQVETYSNEDVQNLARCFTGYHFDYSGTGFDTYPNSTRQIETPDFVTVPITSDPRKWRKPQTASLHSPESKEFLNVSIPQNTSASETLCIALDALFKHPNVAPFFCKQMIQRLVTSNPSGAYVRRVARVFENNGNGKRGDLKAVFKAIILDDEARSDTMLTDENFGKLREPVLRFAQWARTFGATSSSDNWEIRSLSRSYDQLGQSPLRSPTVFNFFRPTFVANRSTASKNGLVAPEFELVNATSVAGYANFMEAIIEDRAFESRDIAAEYRHELPLAENPAELVEHLNLILTANQLSEGEKDGIREAIESVQISDSSDQEARLRRVRLAVFLVFMTTSYLIQR